jgi:hypothetical protein
MDSQLNIYQNHPEKYAEYADKVDLCLLHAAKPCLGGDCDYSTDLGADPCKRHDRTLEVVNRYYRMNHG